MSSLEKLALYEARIEEIERRQTNLARGRTGYMRLFVAIPVVSVLGFLFGVWFGAATLATGILMGIFGFYTVSVREGDYERELDGLRSVVDGLRAEEPTP
jgi:hypothetical protein